MPALVASAIPATATDSMPRAGSILEERAGAVERIVVLGQPHERALAVQVRRRLEDLITSAMSPLHDVFFLA